MYDVMYLGHYIFSTYSLHTQTLLSQANTRRLKKDRRKEIKDALGRYQAIEERLAEMKRGQLGATGSSTRFHVDSPNSHSANSSAALPGSVLGGTRMGPTSSVDDTYIANIIWDSPSHDTLQPTSTRLQRSPLHKSTSALTELQDGGLNTTATPSLIGNYQGQPHITPGNRSYHNTSTTYQPPENLDSSPPTSVAPRNRGMGLPAFNLTEEIFQHFTRAHKEVTPPPSVVPDYLSPRQTSSELRTTQFPIPQTSSPIKRTSSPDLRGDLRAHSNSPDVFLTTPEHHHYRQQPGSHSYSNAYQYPPPVGQKPHSNPPSRSNSNTNFRPGMTGANPQSVTSPYWYDGMTNHPAPPTAHRHQSHSDTMTPFREEGGAYHQGQHPPRSAGMPLPRRQNEESVGIAEFLHDLAKSKTNPFGSEGGTLV